MTVGEFQQYIRNAPLDQMMLVKVNGKYYEIKDPPLVMTTAKHPDGNKEFPVVHIETKETIFKY